MCTPSGLLCVAFGMVHKSSGCILSWYNIYFQWISGVSGEEVLYGTSDGKIGLIQLGR